jgi:putative flippase GtrA
MSSFFGNLIDRSLARFILAGVVNTIVGSVIMFALYNVAQLSYWISSACNYFFTSILSFFVNKYFTFKVRQWSAFMVVAFAANIALCYLAAYGIAKPAVTVLLRQASQNMRENIALLTGMCLFTILNYLGQRLIVFRIKSK